MKVKLRDDFVSKRVIEITDFDHRSRIVTRKVLDRTPQVGSTGFLVLYSRPPGLSGFTAYELHDQPARTNGTRRPMLSGWCGTWNDLATTAKGVHRIVKVTGSRAPWTVTTEQLQGDELAAWLASNGFKQSQLVNGALDTTQAEG